MSSGRKLFLQSAFLALALVVLARGAAPPSALAQSAADIQSQIDDHTQKILALQQEIAQYQKTLDALGTQHQTLQSAIKTIDVSRQQTATQVSLTQNRIAATDLTLTQLRRDIATKQDLINLDQDTVAKAIRDMAAASDRSVVEQVFAADNLSEAWTETDNLSALNATLHQNVHLLNGDKIDLTNKQDAAAQTRAKLAQLQQDLIAQQRALDANKAAKAQLLSQTKNQESAYQKLIAQKKAEQASFQAAIFALASQLKAADTSKVPAASKGILAWPLDTIRITQMFGRTSDSGRLYASGTHDGVDFAAPIGTPVHAALTGTVIETNQGAVQNCQYGKWVLVRHANGLSTLYAHLSEIDVQKGDSVATGQTVGLSGMTGYATGPHLHLTVYNSSSVTFKYYTCHSGNTVYIPIAPTNGYLDPLAYL